MNPQSTIPLHTGRGIPVIGLGTWRLTENTAETVHAALELGYSMIDTSGDYGTQPGIGEGILMSTVDRAQLYIVTKVEETDNAYEAVQKNLHELQLEYADLVLIHRPPKEGAGVDLWRGLIRAKEDGLAIDIGVSNYPTNFIDELIGATSDVPVVNQIEWSPFGHSDEMQSYTQEKEMVIMAYSPLTRTERLSHGTIRTMADKYGKTPAQILIRWNIERGTVPIPKANHTEHLEENINVFDFSLNEEDMRTLNALNEHYSALGTLPYV